MSKPLQKASGWTALFMAVNKHKTEVVTTLLDNGADPKIKDTVCS